MTDGNIAIVASTGDIRSEVQSPVSLRVSRRRRHDVEPQRGQHLPERSHRERDGQRMQRVLQRARMADRGAGMDVNAG